LVAVDNLVSLIKVALTHPKAANQTFLVSDGVDLSTSDLIREIAKGVNKRISLLPIPVTILTNLLTFVGKGAIADRLFGSLQVDITKTKQLLDWKPTVSVQEGIKLMCQGHQSE
jgi:nucleoside-diphosphate-sugar epimerase